MENSFLNESELKSIGFLKVGQGCKISRKCSIYNPEMIEIGDNVRIDDFCILSGKIILKNNIHISAGVFLFAGLAGITIDEYSNVSSRCAIYAITDDFGGDYLVGPCVSSELRHVFCAPVVIEKHCVIGTGSTVMPGVVVSEGSAIGAMSFVNKNTQEWSISFGIPCKHRSKRSKKMLELFKGY